jgi:hypothetical protein
MGAVTPTGTPVKIDTKRIRLDPQDAADHDGHPVLVDTSPAEGALPPRDLLTGSLDSVRRR